MLPNKVSHPFGWRSFKKVERNDNQKPLELPVRASRCLFAQPMRNTLKAGSLIYMRPDPLATDAGLILPTHYYRHQTTSILHGCRPALNSDILFQPAVCLPSYLPARPGTASTHFTESTLSPVYFFHIVFSYIWRIGKKKVAGPSLGCTEWTFSRIYTDGWALRSVSTRCYHPSPDANTKQWFPESVLDIFSLFPIPSHVKLTEK